MLIRSSQLLGCCSDHIQPIGILHPRVRSEPAADTIDPRNSRTSKQTATPRADERVSPQEEERFKDHAFNSAPRSSNRGGCASVAGESLHPHAVVHQVNFERCGGNRRCSLAAQCLWAVPFPIWDSSRKGMRPATPLSKIRRETQTLNEARSQADTAPRRLCENKTVVSRCGGYECASSSPD